MYCPRCGTEQPQSDICKRCGVNILRYIEPSPAPAPQAPVIGASTQRTELIDIGDLLSRSWNIYTLRLGPLLAILLISTLVAVVPIGMAILIGVAVPGGPSSGNNALILVSWVIALIISGIAFLWGQAALIFAVSDEDLGIAEALGRAWQRLCSFSWLYMLLSFITIGGFLLFIVPGVIFSVWFSFAVFIFAIEDERGMNAILKSKEYVRGRWFDVFLRLFIVWLISSGLGAVPCIGFILSLFFFPFMMIYAYLIYEDLTETRAGCSPSLTSREKLKWLGLSTLGYVLMAIIIALIVACCSSFIKKFPPPPEKQEMFQPPPEEVKTGAFTAHG